ncbi:MAG: serine hydrolase [Pseudomonadota bacterium]
MSSKSSGRLVRNASTTIAAGLALLAAVDIAVADEFATADELRLMQGFPPPAGKRVDRSNALFTPPFNRWSYLHMREVYPSAGIPTAPTPVPIRRDIDGGIDALTVARESGEVVGIDTWLRESYSDAVVVIHDDRIVWERYLNGMHADHPHQMMSVTKSFAGLFGLLAIADGGLAEGDPVTDWVPELEASGAFGDATFHDALDMVASMDFSEDYADPASGIVAYGKVLGLIDAPADEIPAASIYDYLATLPADPAHANGEVFHYQTPKTDVVNWVTNRATGRSFEDLFYDRLWSKLGTDGETYVLLDRNGTLFAGGGLNATPNDLARFAWMMSNDGRFQGREVVPVSVIDDLSAGGDVDAFTNGSEPGGVMGGGDWSYRAQWWVRHTTGREAFMAIGVHGQWIYIDVDRDVAIVK